MNIIKELKGFEEVMADLRNEYYENGVDESEMDFTSVEGYISYIEEQNEDSYINGDISIFTDNVLVALLEMDYETVIDGEMGDHKFGDGTSKINWLVKKFKEKQNE